MSDSSVTPILYVKSGCPWCHEVLEYLTEHEIAFEKVTVSNDPEAMREMIALSSQSKAPTMDWDGDVIADFGVDELIPFLEKKGIGG